MASNDFSKEIRVAFEQVLEGFNDAEVMSKAVAVYRTDQTTMARTNDIIWRPQPYIMNVYDGLDQTGNFKPQTQLSVPATIGFKKSVPWSMNSLELRDALQEGRLGDAARQKLSSVINTAVTDVASYQGTVIAALAGTGDYNSIATAETILTELGVNEEGRMIGISPTDYQSMANDLQKASRSFGNEKSDSAYERSTIGTNVANFRALRLQTSRAIRAAAITATIDTRASANNYWVPEATTVSLTGEISNVDNRYQTVTFSSTTTMAAGDCIKIEGVEAVHHITKESTGRLKTFRVIKVLNSTQAVISPPIQSAQGGSSAERAYQNCIVTPSATAAVDQLNSVATRINPFWVRDAIEILPGRIAVPAGAGVQIMRGTTDTGLELVMAKWVDGNTYETNFRFDCFFGVTNLQPEMTGALLLNQ